MREFRVSQDYIIFRLSAIPFQSLYIFIAKFLDKIFFKHFISLCLFYIVRNHMQQQNIFGIFHAFQNIFYSPISITFVSEYENVYQ